MTDQARPVVLGLIPARGGSKSVPRKNLHPLGGVPLIVHTIEVARGAKRLTRTIVSTDDEEIAQVAREAGVYVPFLRPAQFAQDESLDQEAFRHALEWLAAEEAYAVDYLVTLRPTSPLRLAEHIDEAVALALSSQADVVKTVTEASVPPHKTWRIAGDRMVPLVPSVLWDRRGPDVPRQSLEPAYWQNGLVDVWKADIILNPPASYQSLTFVPLLIDARYVVDLDSEEDFALAELMLAQHNRTVT